MNGKAMNMINLTALLSLALLSAGCAHQDDRDRPGSSSAAGGDVPMKAAQYRQKLVADPSDAAIRLQYAEALSRQGKYHAAEEQFTTMLMQQPDNLDAMTALGYTYVWSYRYDLAEKQFKRALDNAPHDFGVQKGLAFTYLCSGRSSQALTAFRSLHEQHPEDLEILAAIESTEAGLIGHARQDQE
jgi:Flp pilus assembly protein TadD